MHDDYCRTPLFGAYIFAITSIYKELTMRALLSIVTLLSISLPAFAEPTVPEPEILSLFGIGAVGLLVALRRKK